MIKLEDLKIGDCIYGVTSDGLGFYQKSIVEKELFMLDLYPKSVEAVLCKGGLEIIPRGYEDFLFRTKKEAEEKLSSLRFKLANDLLKSNNFMDRLLECATSSKRLDRYSEYPIYQLAVELYKEGIANSNC